MITPEALERHRDHLTSLSVDGEPLSPASPHATVHNPAWFDQATGAATPVRQRLHERILARAAERSAHVPRERQAIVLAGPPGAGKTSVLTDVLRARRGPEAHLENWRTLNSDDFKDELLEHAHTDGSYEAFLKPPAVRDLEARGERFHPRDLAALVHEESSLLNRLAFTDAVRAGQNIVIDGTLSKASRADQMLHGLALAGYEVTVVDVEAPREVTQQRVANRWREGYLDAEQRTAAGEEPGMGGRWVPTSFSGSLYGAGRDDRSVCEDVARQVAERHPVVRELHVYRVNAVEAAPVPSDVRGRVAGGPLMDSETYAARRAAARGTPASTRHRSPAPPDLER
ncbi:zeta toxin family protein [Cellulomonas sp. NPDC055163]